MSEATPPRSRRLHWLALLVPVLAAALVLRMQPEDQLGVEGDNPFRTRIFYDDADMAAFALRGINANLGRPPGPIEPKIDAAIIGAFDENLRLNRHPPLLKEYFLEYPHAALFLFRGVMASIPVEGSWPSTVLDFHYANVIFYKPKTDDERLMWSTFRRAARVFLVINVAALLLMMALLLRGLGRNGEWAGPAWLLTLPAMLYFTMSRFDALPSLFVVLGLAAAGRNRTFTSGACLGFATALKLYPLVIAPLVWRWMAKDVRTGFAWAIGFLLPIAATFGTGIALDGVDGVLAPFQFQLKRPLEPDWVLYGRVLPMALAESSLARLGILGGIAAVLFVLKPGDMGSLLRRCTILLVVFASLQQFFSPQWLLWFVPLLVPLARRSWFLIVLLVVLDLVIYLSFPLVFDHGEVWQKETLIYARGVLMGLLLAWLAWSEVVYVIRAFLTLTPPPSSTSLR